MTEAEALIARLLERLEMVGQKWSAEHVRRNLPFVITQEAFEKMKAEREKHL